MFATNLKIALIVLGTLAAYTAVANMIPQIESEVPEALEFTGAVTAEQLVAAGEELFNGGGGCTACHGLGTRAPNLLADDGGSGTIGARCGARVADMSCKAYLHQSLVEPNAFVVSGYQPIMPAMNRTLSPAQLWSLVAYLESQGGTVTVTAADVQAAGPQPAAGQPAGAGAAASGPASAPGQAQAAGASLDPLAILRSNTCLACHQIAGEGAPIGPALDGIGARQDADYIRRAILEPNADTAAGYEAVAGTMPPTFGQQLSAAQLEALVQYLAGQQ